jgi:hypothetical protein
VGRARVESGSSIYGREGLASRIHFRAGAQSCFKERMTFRRFMQRFAFAFAVGAVTNGLAQPLERNLTPREYVERTGGGASIVPAGKLMIDGRRMTRGQWPTVLDPGLDDYAGGFSGFAILNPRLLARVSTPVKLWIYAHECGHLNGIRDDSKADCFGVQRGRREGWLTPQGLDQVCAFISGGRADALHPSGPDRCARMRLCAQ